MNDNDTLLLFSIGPVQSFIAEARRTHDLWAGSKMLVDITRTAIKAIDPNGEKLVFPAHVKESKQKSIPNIFAMIVSWDEVKNLARNAQDEAEKRLNEIANNAKKRLLQSAGMIADGIFENIWNEQLSRHLEFNWVACKKKLDETYGEWYKRARLALEARKRTRNFQQAEEPGMKDSLSGQRSALHTQSKDAREFWQEVQTKIKNKTMLQAGGRERLDSIGLAKRFSKWEELDSFPSTSSVAASLFLELAAEKAPDQLKQFEQRLDDLEKNGLIFQVPHFNDALIALPKWHHDGIYFFEQRLSDTVIERELGRADKNGKTLSTEEKRLLNKARNKLRAMYREIGTPSTYYAILLLDGDNMGEHISNCNGEKEHKDLSQCLEDFARSVNGIIGSGSSVIYAGGDDLLALLPLRNALESAQRLREKYVEVFSNWTKNHPNKTGTNEKFTCSVGIAIAHHLSPLDAILQEAREAEKRAKNIYQRNAISITVIKRSGEPVEVGSKWALGDIDTLKPFIDANTGIISLFENGKIAMKFPYDVAQEASALIGLPEEAYEASLRRLLKRHAPKLENNEALAKKLAEVAYKMDAEAKSNLKANEQDVHRGPVELANWLLLARFIAQGGNE